MIPFMKLALWTLPAFVCITFLTSCGNRRSNNPNAVTGPFDRNGNYREEWADNPTKWRKAGGAPSPHETKTDELPEIASNDQPPQNSVPLVSGNNSKPTPVISSTPIKTSTQATKTTPTRTTTTVVKAKPKSKPKPVLVKPKTTRYVVKSGDSLSKIASRTGSSVSALQRANSISGTLIRPGQSLVIPKK